MPSKSEYRIASDGLPARLSGAWAEEKLQALDAYIGTVNTAMGTRKSWKRLCYVDLLAGCGGCILEDGREFDGSPIRLFSTGTTFTDATFVEEDAGLASALRSRLTHRAGIAPIVIEGDCNTPEVYREVHKAMPPDGLSIVFVDNLGLDVSFAALSNIVAGRRADLVVTFQVSDMTRNAEAAMNNAHEAKRWTDFFGSASWREVIADYESRKTTAGSVGIALGEFYERQMRKLGYRHATQLNRTMKNMRNAPLYRLMLFSKHELAKKLFDVSTGGDQRNLFR